MTRRKIELDPRRRISQPMDSSATVKSAARTMQILEFFDDVRCEASVMSIAEALGYPQSSTSALLRSLVTLGYIHYNPGNRTYITSTRVALLGNWISPHFIAEGTVMQMMRELSDKTGDTIVLAQRNQMYTQYIHVIQATSPARLHITLGTVRPLAYSGTGYAILSTLSTQDVTRIVTRYNAELHTEERRVGVRAVLEKLEEVRRKGYVFTQGFQTPGGGMIAASIPQPQGKLPLALGIAGIVEVMKSREEELATALLDVLRRYVPA